MDVERGLDHLSVHGWILGCRPSEQTAVVHGATMYPRTVSSWWLVELGFAGPILKVLFKKFLFGSREEVTREEAESLACLQALQKDPTTRPGAASMKAGKGWIPVQDAQEYEGL